MSDPLSLVKKAVANGDALLLQDGGYHLFGNLFPADTKTAFKRSLGADEHYHTLREIIFCYHNAGLSLVDYRKNCLQEKLKALVEADRASLLSYLRGEVATCAQIDQHMVDSYVPPVPTSTRTKRKVDEMHTSAVDAVLAPTGSSTAITGDSSELSADAEQLHKLRAKFFPMYPSKSSIYNVGGKEDFRSVLKIFNNTVLARAVSDPAQPATSSSNHHSSHDSHKSKQAKVSTGASATSSSSSSAAAAAAALVGKKANSSSSSQRLKPIIVVPTALTSCINMFNAKAFLEDGKYSKPEDVMAATGAEKKKVDVILRRHAGRVHLYKIVDDPSQLPPEEWDRIAAVFVSGQTWQFNRWTVSDPVQLFQQVLAVHLMLDNRPIDPVVASWNCRVLKVDEFQDYVNAGVASQFWLWLDDFLLRKKPHLLPPAAPAQMTSGSVGVPMHLSTDNQLSSNAALAAGSTSSTL